MEGVEDAYPFGEKHHGVLKENVQQLNIPDGIEVEDAEVDIEDCFISLMKSHVG